MPDETLNLVLQRYQSEADFYDVLYDPKEDIQMYIKFGGEAGGTVLECACGTGRVTIPLAKAGIPVVGLDISSKMLQIARRKLKRESAAVRDRVRLERGDMRDIHLEDRFKLCLVPFGSFLHLVTKEDQRGALASIRKHLEPGGRLIFDAFNPDPNRPQGVPRLDKVRSWKGQTLMRWIVQWIDSANHTTNGWIIYDFVRSSGSIRRMVVPYNLRFFYMKEMKELLTHAGFTVEAVFGGYDQKPFKKSSQRIIFVTRRPLNS